MTRYGTFEDLLMVAGTTTRPLCRALRSLVPDVHPEATETVRLGDRSATYGLGPKKMTEGYCYIQPQRDWVNLGFYQGAVLPDPQGILEGTGVRLRHVKVRRAEDAARPALADLVVAALEERRLVLG